MKSAQSVPKWPQCDLKTDVGGHLAHFGAFLVPFGAFPDSFGAFRVPFGAFLAPQWAR